MSTTMIAGAGLKTPLQTHLPPNNPAVETNVVAEIKKRIENSKSPVIIVDGGRYNQMCSQRGHEALHKERHRTGGDKS
jgi:TPP-dependent 2-oxoacid decarboxylase